MILILIEGQKAIGRKIAMSKRCVKDKHDTITFVKKTTLNMRYLFFNMQSS